MVMTRPQCKWQILQSVQWLFSSSGVKDPRPGAPQACWKSYPVLWTRMDGGNWSSNKPEHLLQIIHQQRPFRTHLLKKQRKLAHKDLGWTGQEGDPLCSTVTEQLGCWGIHLHCRFILSPQALRSISHLQERSSGRWSAFLNPLFLPL